MIMQYYLKNNMYYECIQFFIIQSILTTVFCFAPVYGLIDQYVDCRMAGTPFWGALTCCYAITAIIGWYVWLRWIYKNCLN
jgi:hypothetical protein